MSGYYASNPHYAPDDFSEERERLERAEERAGKWFAKATVRQLCEYNRSMADLRGLEAPRYDRAREQVIREWDDSTKAARELYDRTVAELMANGEISESLSYEWDDLLASVDQVQLQFAAE